MKFDLRIPMGLMFSFMGAILATWGIKTNDNVSLYTRSLGVNINLWWGMVLLAFGVAMFILGQRSRRLSDGHLPPVPQKESKRRKR